MTMSIKAVPSLAKLVGTWTHTLGAAAETIAVSGKVWGAEFKVNLSSGATEPEVKWSDSLSGNVSTITLYCNTTITDGRFIIFYTPA